MQITIEKIVSYLEYVGLSLLTSRKKQFFFFSFVSILSLLIHGYHVGTFDQASHLPFLKKNADPFLYPNDNYFNLRFSHYSYFWIFFMPFYKVGFLEPVMFLTYLTALYFTFFLIWRLALELTKNHLSALLSVLAFSFPHFGFAGFPLIEFSLLNRTFVLPLLLLSLLWYIQKKRFRSLLLLGVLYNIHAVSVHFVLAMFGTDILLHFKKTGLKNIALMGILFITGAFPVLIWKLGSPVGSELTINWDWYRLIADGILGNIFYTFSTHIPHIIIATLCGLGTYGLFLISFFQNHAHYPHKRTLFSFFVGITVVLIVQAVSSYFFPLTILIQAQIVRVGTFLLIFSYIYFVYFLVSQYKKQSISPKQFSLLILFTLFVPAPFLLIFTYFVQKSKNTILQYVTYLGVLCCIVGAGIYMYSQSLWLPGIYLYPRKTALYNVQEWAKKHTNRNEVFLVPPYLWGFYDLEWRVISERSAFVTLSELLEAAFEPNYTAYWTSRFDQLLPGIRTTFKGDFFENKKNIRKAYLSLSQETIKQISIRNSIHYFVTESHNRNYSFPVVYSNAQYTVYKVQ